MSPGAIKALEMVLVFGLVLGFGFWELYKLRKDKKERAAKEAEQKNEGPQ